MKITCSLTNKIIAELIKNNADVYIVGGFVRDNILKKEEKGDIDLEVHNISFNEVQEIIASFARYKIQGSFGVLKIIGTKTEISMPRYENAIGQKHQDFAINIDPYMGTKEAAKRRDFTINSIMYNVKTDKIIDHYNGCEDLKNKIIRHISSKFSEDALRVFRAVRFSSQLGFSVAPETIDLCLVMQPQIGLVAAARKNNELDKFFLGEYLDLGLEAFEQILVPYFNFQPLIKLAQNERYHPEKYVWAHVKQTLLACWYNRYNHEEKDYLIIMYALLLHDIGKLTTTTINNQRISSAGHEHASYIAALPILEDVLINKRAQKLISLYVRDHMMPFYIDKMRAKKVVELYNLYGDNFINLVYISVYDKAGRSKQNDKAEILANTKKLEGDILEKWQEIITFLTALYVKYNGKYFINQGYHGVEIKIKQQEQVTAELKDYLNNRRQFQVNE